MPLGAARINGLSKYAAASRTALTVTAGGNAQVSTAQSKFGGASAVFDGLGDYITISSMPSTSNSDFTFEFWARFDILPWDQTAGGGAYMIAGYTGGNLPYYNIYREGSSGSQPKVQIALPGDRYGSFTKSGLSLAINTWYHFAFVRTSGVCKAFFNGTELTTFTNDYQFTNSGRTENMSFSQLGKFGDDRGSWDGYMDEIRVSNIARYSGDFTPPSSAFTNDANTLLLMHTDGTNGSTTFTDSTS